MTTADTGQDDDRGLVIEIEKTLPADREEVFHRWTDAGALARWFAPPGYITVQAESDPRPGGAWRLSFRSTAGDHAYTEQGTFLDLVPHCHLALTLTQTDGAHANPETLVAVALDDVSTGAGPLTRMRFTQTGYESAALRNDNEQGWLGCFAALADDLAPSASETNATRVAER